MSQTLDPLVRDLVAWIAHEPRCYADVLDAWRTSCPRLPVWEEAVDRGGSGGRSGGGGFGLPSGPRGGGWGGGFGGGFGGTGGGFSGGGGGFGGVPNTSPSEQHAGRNNPHQLERVSTS